MRRLAAVVAMRFLSRFMGGCQWGLSRGGEYGGMRRTCTCGHDRAAHRHYRRGSDCASCAIGECPRYRSDLFRRVIGGFVVERRRRAGSRSADASGVDRRVA
jgi:hypothetical protein